jgi:hypothetical protein
VGSSTFDNPICLHGPLRGYLYFYFIQITLKGNFLAVWKTFEVLAVMNIKITVVCNVILCSSVDKYQHFRGTYCLHLQGERISHGEKTTSYSTLKVEGAGSSETLIIVYQSTWRHIAKHSDLRNLKSHRTRYLAAVWTSWPSLLCVL